MNIFLLCNLLNGEVLALQGHVSQNRMTRHQRDIILLLKDNNISSVLLAQQVQCLHRVIGDVEKEETFCKVHELVNRNSITARRSKILNAIACAELKPFKFLICKN